ncbi:DUF4352 domain-containing protein [Bacillus sp. REN16]|uniref:DUF4352 domain-containing protein n=1 Tax=Bacillus sp. REN16 TaxID=2887296 RepID=UPI001E5C36DD|nr:DUF4352 domain-containing protein [Bacillus sp. REN16]MCC3357881.1 DUF4352 domain-containing protein [Bacillus sp. REN16]
MSEGKKIKGKKPFYKRIWVWVLAVIIIGVIASGGEEEGTEQASTTPKTDVSVEKNETKKEEQVDKEEPEEKVQTAGIGQPLKVGEVVFTVTGTSTATNIGGEYGKNSSGEFFILDVIVKNEGKEAITTDSSFFKLKSGDITYEADTEAGIWANQDNNFFLQDVNPGIENKGKVVFDIPAGTSNLVLQVQTGFWGTETGEISLQ